MGQSAGTNYKNSYDREDLLSMLYPRLNLAKQLLSDEGVIFCSIDDKNQAYVKGLFDEIFGEENFVASVPRKTGAGNAAVRNDASLRKPFDYLLVYKLKNTIFQKKIVGEKEFNMKDKYGYFRLEQFQASGSDATRKARPNLYYPIYLDNEGKLSTNKTEKTIKTILPSKVHGEDGRWMWKSEKFDIDCEKFIYWDGNKLHRKNYYDSDKDNNVYQVEQAWLDNSNYRNSNGTNELNNILCSEKPLFSNPKPVELIKWCVNLHPNKDAIILDFFAGSGTTGQAVMELNREDGGNRQFILCTNNEKTDLNPNGIAYDVTVPRLEIIMAGTKYHKKSDSKWLEKNEPYGDNLDVFEISEIENFKTEEILESIDETCYGLEKFDNYLDKIKWIAENFENAQLKLEDEDE